MSDTQMFHRTLLQLLAGGPGSGCHGDNCGRPRGAAKVYQTAAGYHYTILKPSKKGIPRGKSDYKKKTSNFKGQFTEARDPKSNQAIAHSRGKEGRSDVYDAWYKSGTGDTLAGHGVTLFVHKDFKNMRMMVHEVPHDDMQKSAVGKVFYFKNFGQGAGFLNRRYAIRQKLPKAGK